MSERQLVTILFNRSVNAVVTAVSALAITVAATVAATITASSLFAADRLELDNTSIKGSRELPKVLYIVPWKESRIGTLAGVAEKGSFKDSMTALDRDLFLRELKYYNVLNRPEAVSRQ